MPVGLALVVLLGNFVAGSRPSTDYFVQSDVCPLDGTDMSNVSADEPDWLLLSAKASGMPRLTKGSLRRLAMPDDVVPSEVVYSSDISECSTALIGPGLVAGPVMPASVLDSNPGILEEKTWVINFSGQSTATISYECSGKQKSAAGCTLVLSQADRHQLLMPYLGGQADSIEHPYMPQLTSISIDFAGDLDHDGKVDLIMQWATKGTSQGGPWCSGTTMYLSQPAGSGELLKPFDGSSECD